MLCTFIVPTFFFVLSIQGLVCDDFLTLIPEDEFQRLGIFLLCLDARVILLFFFFFFLLSISSIKN